MPEPTGNGNGNGNGKNGINKTLRTQGRPNFIKGKIHVKTYDGNGDDLLTGGLGMAGLLSPKPPVFDDPENPRPEELRKRAVYFGYRYLLDMSPKVFGKLYGPGSGDDKGGETVAGEEYIAHADDKNGVTNITLMLQLPARFDPENPRMVAVASSGSRGIHGSIATVGHWALSRGFAVVYTDKGSGTGVHDMGLDRVLTGDGRCLPAREAGESASFIASTATTAPGSPGEIPPTAVAFKHAHSRVNPEAAWGAHLLMAVEFAYYLLNERFKYNPPITSENTMVIAAGISNGGAAAIRAAEMDEAGLISGVCASAPNVNPVFDPGFSIVQGDRPPVLQHSRTLLDYTTLLNIFVPAASLSPELSQAPFNIPRGAAENRCRSLMEKGLLKGESTEEAAEEAIRIISDYGILPDQNILAPCHFQFRFTQAIAVTYANQYGRFGPADNLCGYCFSAVNNLEEGKPVPLPRNLMAALFSDGSGCPPTGGVHLINLDSMEGPVEEMLSVSPTTGRRDMNLDGALGLRRLAAGTDERTGKALLGRELDNYTRVQKGISEIRATGKLKGLPSVIVCGRSDAMLAPNHTSRAYFGLNKRVDPESALSYYEITSVQHLDFLNYLLAKKGFWHAPLHYYFLKALDVLYEHLEKGTPIPESQVVRPDPESPLPPIDADPPAANIIRYKNRKVTIPE